MKTPFLSLLLLFSSFHFVSGQSFELSPNVLAAYSDFINLRLEKGAEKLSEKPENGMKIYLENYGDIIKILASQDKELYKKLEKNENIRLKKLKSFDKNSPYYRLAQAEIKMHWVIVKINFNEYLGAAWKINSAYKLIQRNQELFPNFEGNKKLLGIFNLYMGSVPSDYTWLINLFGFKGNKEIGVKYLDELAQSNHLLNLEGAISKIYLQTYLLNKKEDGYQAITELRKKNPNQLLVDYIAIGVCNSTNRSQEALSIMAELPKNDDYIAIGSFHYMKGSLLLKTGKYKEAIAELEQFLKEYKGEKNVRDAYFKIFLCKWFTNQTDANSYLEKIKNYEGLNSSKDKYAVKFANFEQLPNKKITEARFLFDGGSFEKAVSILDNVNTKRLPQKDKVELFYRKSRIFHKQKSYDKAIKMYEKTIRISKDLPHYFAPNSALQLGYIYRDIRHNEEKAKQYFNKVLTYNKHEYKSDLDYEAKTALKLME